MKTEREYNLQEAINKFYKTEPLKIDLSTNVANRIFVKRKIEIALLDKWLYAFAAVLIFSGLIYSFILANPPSLLFASVIILPIVFFSGLSVKEYKLMSEKILSLE
ncbi:MAG: hypothetical protein NT040_00900 [Bacteroidetes bacterium]|nr:hypothetical protein [Bacteroidota bacterium]